MKINTLVAILFSLAIVTASSCQKEVDSVNLDGGNNNPCPGTPPGSNPSDRSFIGEWKFKKMIADVQTSMEGTQNGVAQKNVVSMKFESNSEGGIIKIDATEIITNDLTFKGNATSIITTYLNGTLIGSVPQVFPIDQAPTDGQAGYTKIGTDSLVTTSSLTDLNIPGMPVAPDISTGIKVSWLGDTLVMTTTMKEDRIDNSLGTPIAMKTTGWQILKLVKN